MGLALTFLASITLWITALLWSVIRERTARAPEPTAPRSLP